MGSEVPKSPQKKMILAQNLKQNPENLKTSKLAYFMLFPS